MIVTFSIETLSKRYNVIRVQKLNHIVLKQVSDKISDTYFIRNDFV